MTSVISPDNNQLLIKGSVNIQNDLDVHGTVTFDGALSTADEVSIASNKNIDLNAPLAADAALDVTGGAYVGGHLYVGGTLLANGDVITLGNSGGNLTLSANIDSDIKPSTTDTYDIGSATLQWRRLYTESLFIDSNPHTISSSDTQITSPSSLCYFDLNSATALSLVNQDPGLVKNFVLLSQPGSPITVTPISAVGFTSFTMVNEGDTISLISTTSGWAISSIFRTTVT